MTQPEIQFDLLIADKEADPEQLDELTVRLMRDLRELGAESVERPAGDTLPEGAKGDPFTIGALALVAVPTVLPSLVNLLQAWSLRGESRRVKIKTPSGLEIDIPEDMSEEKLMSLVGKLVQTQADEDKPHKEVERVGRGQEVSGSGSAASDGGVSAGQSGVAVGRDIHGSVIIAGEKGFDEFRRTEEYRDLQKKRDALRDILGHIVPELEAILTIAVDTSRREALQPRVVEPCRRLESISPLFHSRGTVKGALLRLGQLVGSAVLPQFPLTNVAFDVFYEDRKILEDELTAIEELLSG